MSLIIVIKSGPANGKSLPITEGLTVGRATGAQGLMVPDPKASLVHAKIEKNTEGDYVLVDQGSRNGILHNGQRITSLVLKPGVVFQIGRTLIEIQAQDSSTVNPAPPKQNAATSTQTESNQPALHIPSHQDKEDRIYAKFGQILAEASQRVTNSPKELVPVYPCLELHFRRGVHTGETHVIGYTPRNIGRDTLGFAIKDDQCPPIAFTLLASPAGTQFSTEIPQLVMLNQKQISTEILKEGDIITVGQNEIEIGFADELS